MTFKHLCEVEISFEENTGQRLDIVNFPRIIGDFWKERERERKIENTEWGKERKRESGPAAIPGIPLIWSYVPLSED